MVAGGGRRSPPHPLVKNLGGGGGRGKGFGVGCKVSARVAALDAPRGAANGVNGSKAVHGANRFCVLGKLPQDQEEDAQLSAQQQGTDALHPAQAHMECDSRSSGWIAAKGMQASPPPGTNSMVEQCKLALPQPQNAPFRFGPADFERPAPAATTEQILQEGSIQVTPTPLSDARMEDSNTPNCNLQFFCKRGDSAMSETANLLDCTHAVCENAAIGVKSPNVVDNSEIHKPNWSLGNEQQSQSLDDYKCKATVLPSHHGPAPPSNFGIQKQISGKTVDQDMVNAKSNDECTTNVGNAVPTAPMQSPFQNAGCSLKASTINEQDTSRSGTTETQHFMASKSGATNVWNKPDHLKICWNIPTFKHEGAVSLNLDAVEANQQKLERALVGKLMGRKLPFSVLLAELKKRWGYAGSFHLVMVSEECFTCIFESLEARESILHGGPWIIAGYIVGLDKWTPTFSPTSTSGFTAPIWIRLPHLPLLYWDNDNIARMASWVGTPLLIDTFTRSWGRSSYARVCVRVDLSQSLPKGIWINGIHGKFFQPIQYEGVSSICFSCGMLGHKEGSCPMQLPKAHPVKPVPGHTNVGAGFQPSSEPSTSKNSTAVMNDPGEWKVVTHKKNKPKRDMKHANVLKELPKEDTQARKDKQPLAAATPKLSPVSASEPVVKPSIAGVIPQHSSHQAHVPPHRTADVFPAEALTPLIFTSKATASSKSKARVSKAHFDKELSRLGPIANDSRKRKKQMHDVDLEYIMEDNTPSHLHNCSRGGDASPSLGK